MNHAYLATIEPAAIPRRERRQPLPAGSVLNYYVYTSGWTSTLPSFGR